MEVFSRLEAWMISNPLERWILSAGIFLGVLALAWLLLFLVRHRLRAFSQGTETVLDDLVVAVLSRTKKALVALVALHFAIQALVVPESVGRFSSQVAGLALLLQVGIWCSAGLNAWVESYRERRAGEGEVATWLGGLQWIGRFFIWTLVFLVGLENLGVDITGLATGLGISGIAVALAVQNILGDLFASFSIYLDRPFVIGDSLKVGNDVGSVESIGLKTTRLRSPSGEQLVISNADLLKSRIRNFGRMVERRAVFEVGVTYDTPIDVLERIPEMIQEAVVSQDNTRFARSHLKSLGESAVLVETVYFMLIADYTAFLDAQQSINLEILRRFEEAGINLAFPTSRVLFEEQRQSD